MYTKEQLEKLPIPELMAIASELGVKVSQNDEFENVVYAILDKAAEQVAAGEPVSKRKRTRIAKDNSKVYTVNGSESTTLDKKATKAGKKPTLDALIAEQAAAEKAETEQTEQAEEKPAPKKRTVFSVCVTCITTCLPSEYLAELYSNSRIVLIR